MSHFSADICTLLTKSFRIVAPRPTLLAAEPAPERLFNDPRLVGFSDDGCGTSRASCSIFSSSPAANLSNLSTLRSKLMFRRHWWPSMSVYYYSASNPAVVVFVPSYLLVPEPPLLACFLGLKLLLLVNSSTFLRMFRVLQSEYMPSNSRIYLLPAPPFAWICPVTAPSALLP